MNPRFLLVIGLAVGYVLGARAGRERYDQMKARVTGLWEAPRVRKARIDIEAFARQQAPIIRERAEAAAKAAPGVIAGGAKDVAGKLSDAADKLSDAAADIRDQVTKAASDLRYRGDAAVDRAVHSAAQARDNALETDDDEDTRG